MIFHISIEFYHAIEAFAKSGININKTDKFGRTPIHFAIELGESTLVSGRMKKKNFRQYAKCSSFYFGLFLCLGLESVVKCLIESYAKTEMNAVNALNDDGKSPLYLALKMGKYERSSCYGH